MEKDFYLQEHTLLREKIEKKIETIERIQVLVIGANASLFAWALTAKIGPISAGMGAGLSILLTLFGAWRHETLVHYVDHVCEYVRELEASLADAAGPGGWERFYDSERSGLKSWRERFWLAVLLVSAIGVAAVVWIKINATAPA